MVDHTLKQDQELIQQFVNNQSKAVELIYKKSFTMIKSMLIQSGCSEQDTEDIFQEALIVLYHQAQKPEFVLSSSISTYLYSVSRKLWLKKINHKRTINWVENTDILEYYASNHTAIDTEDEQEILLQKMEKALNTLGEPCKSLLQHFYIHDWSMQQIVKELGYNNTDTAKNQKYKCLMRLKKIFFNKENTLTHE